MREETLEKLLRDADERSGPAPSVTMEGIRRAGQRRVLRRAGAAMLAMGIVAGGATWRQAIVQRREARLVAELRAVTDEIAEHEARVGQLLEAERLSQGRTGELVRRATSPETGLIERAAAANFVAGDALAGGPSSAEASREAYATVVRDFPGTLAAAMAGERMASMNGVTTQGARQ